MTTTERMTAAITRAASVTLRRTCAAFDLVRAQFVLDVAPSVRGDHVQIMLTYEPRDGRRPLSQIREVPTFPGAAARRIAETRIVIDEMVRNVALAFRREQVATPSGWSIHPAAASIIAASGTDFPNPADPTTWLQRANGEIHLPDGGPVADAVFTGSEGVLLLRHARIVGPGGVKLATISMDGPLMLVEVAGTYPETLVDALPGRSAETLCAVFAADPRGADAVIARAVSVPVFEPSVIVELVDQLVPLLPSCPGGERWRPRKAIGICGRDTGGLYRLLGHRRDVAARYYRHATHAARRARPAGKQAKALDMPQRVSP